MVTFTFSVSVKCETAVYVWVKSRGSYIIAWPQSNKLGSADRIDTRAWCFRSAVRRLWYSNCLCSNCSLTLWRYQADNDHHHHHYHYHHNAPITCHLHNAINWNCWPMKLRFVLHFADYFAISHSHIAKILLQFSPGWKTHEVLYGIYINYRFKKKQNVIVLCWLGFETYPNVLLVLCAKMTEAWTRIFRQFGRLGHGLVPSNHFHRVVCCSNVIFQTK